MAREGLGELEQQILLAVLRLGGEAYSVPIVEELEARTGRDVAQAAVFIVLRRLESKGLLSSRFEDRTQAGGRIRRYFKLTPEAAERLRASRRQLLRLWEGVETLLEKA
jgi:DNA-binding PadR family transcriptional regulator